MFHGGKSRCDFDGAAVIPQRACGACGGGQGHENLTRGADTDALGAVGLDNHLPGCAAAAAFDGAYAGGVGGGLPVDDKCLVICGAGVGVGHAPTVCICAFAQKCVIVPLASDAQVRRVPREVAVKNCISTYGHCHFPEHRGRCGRD